MLCALSNIGASFCRFRVTVRVSRVRARIRPEFVLRGPFTVGNVLKHYSNDVVSIAIPVMLHWQIHVHTVRADLRAHALICARFVAIELTEN